MYVSESLEIISICGTLFTSQESDCERQPIAVLFLRCSLPNVFTSKVQPSRNAKPYEKLKPLKISQMSSIRRKHSKPNDGQEVKLQGQ